MRLRATIDDLLESPNLKLVYEEVGETLRREEKARQKFRDSLRDGERSEFINGRVRRQMTARDRHTYVVFNVHNLLGNHTRLRNLGIVRQEQALTAFSRNDYCPDLCFWGKAKSKNITPDQTIYPVPDFICEVLSPSTAAVDRGVKFQDYEAHGVHEYWMIDPDLEMIEQYVLQGDRYESIGRFTKGNIRSRAIRGFRMPVRAAFDEEENTACLKRILGT